MAETKTLKTRISLLSKSYAEWQTLEDKILLKGEVGICTVPTNTGVAQNEPCVLLKIGDGTTAFKNLPWLSALAADIYAWAKKASLDFNDLDATFLAALDARILEKAGEQSEANYRLINDQDNGIYKLQKQAADASWVDVTGSATLDTTIFATKDDISTLSADKIIFTPEAGSAISATTVNAAIIETYAESKITVEKQETAEEGYAATYVIKQPSGLPDGFKINIPKDFLVKSAELKTVEIADTPYTGATIGDKYIDFIINTKDSTDAADESHIYLAVKDLVDTYTADEITINLVDKQFKLADTYKTKLDNAITNEDYLILDCNAYDI